MKKKKVYITQQTLGKDFSVAVIPQDFDKYLKSLNYETKNSF